MKAAVWCDGRGRGEVDCCLGGRAAVAAEARRALSGNGGDDAVRPDPSDAVVKSIADMKAAVWCHCHARGEVDCCLGGRAAVSVEARRALFSDSGDDALRPDPADAVVKRICDIKATV